MKKLSVPFICIFILILPLKTTAQSNISISNARSLFSVPDIILHNANVITLDDKMPNAQAIAIEGNRISAVGTNVEILALQTASTQLIDLGGKTVLPGLIEGHDHLLSRGYRETGSAGLVAATQRMAANGYTTVHQLGGSPDFIGTAQDLAQKGDLAVRINFYQQFNNSCGDDVNYWNIYPYTEKKDTTVRVVGVKIFSDGGTCGKAPALTTFYQSGSSFAGGYGDLFRTQEEMNQIVDTVLKAGYPIAMHAIGDSAVGVGLNAFENSFTGKGNALRCRMEHLTVMREDLADQMAAIGIAASIQYTWARAIIAPAYESRYLPQVLEWIYPWRRLANREIPIVGGNDFPFSSIIQSMQTISYLATRKMERSDTLASWLDGDQLTVEEGIRAMTKTNAWVVFEEDVKGTITPGKLADLTILSDDPLAIDPFDVRYINIEMTIMDGVIRHNKLNQVRNAVHNAGLFSMGIDDRGLWGNRGPPVGLQFRGIEQMFQGSVLISYDSSTVATADYFQQDYATAPDGWVQFREPGTIASEEATVLYEDVSTNHPNSLRIRQDTFMWEGDPILLVKYTFENMHDYSVSDLYLGQFMVFEITGSDNEWTSYLDDLAGWEENDGLGFAYQYDNDPTTPYIGVAMFDQSGKNTNNVLDFYAGYRLMLGEDESRFSQIMRSGFFNSEASTPSDYSILMSSGPFSIDGGQSISPFIIAFVVGENLDDLKNVVNQAYQRSTQVLSVKKKSGQVLDEFLLFKNYPNPFNPITTVHYNLPKETHINITIYDMLGRKVHELISQKQLAGNHSIQWNGVNHQGVPVSAGIYFYQLKAGEFVQTKKMVLFK